MSGPSLRMDLTRNRSFDGEGHRVYHEKPPDYAQLRKPKTPISGTNKPPHVCEEIEKGNSKLILLPIHKEKKQGLDHTHQQLVEKNIHVI